MQLNLHFLHSHLDFIPLKMGAMCNQYGKGFHQEISQMEMRYSGKWELKYIG